jgi:hypothetical protein
MSTTELLIIPSSTTAKTGNDVGNRSAATPRGGISFREAALRLQISEKTLRARIRSGEVDGWTVEGKRGLEWRVHLPEGRAGLPEGREDGRDDAHGERDLVRDLDRDLPVLQARLDGALLAARLHADRRRHVEHQAQRDRDEARGQQDRLHAEVEFLRQQLQQRADAERELRLLLASTQQAIQAITARPALEANTPPTRTAWWKLWKRG